MKNLKPLIILNLILVTTAVFPPHKAVQKSLQRAEYECKQYLQTPDSPCQPRCVQLVLRSWNDTTGLIHVPYSRHFRPSFDDLDNKQRTNKCLKAGLCHVPQNDVCRRSCVSWECYRDQYGVLHGSPQFIPMPRLLLANTIEQCAQMLQISLPELRQHYAKGFQLSAKSRCLLRCALIREGLYSDMRGVNLERLFVQCGREDTDECAFKDQTSQCVDKLRVQCSDRCPLASRIASECIPGCSGGGIPTCLVGDVSDLPEVSSIVPRSAASASPEDLDNVQEGLPDANAQMQLDMINDILRGLSVTYGL